ncbi:MAG TPA: UDP-3-O-(3-hydroxymyristoyl)glucosamine N-acyltransferase [Pyrinomonadaceae bacterium]|nr:UDP-3-O-(3-hydroxymyristoyl)glucosamine N-acyltransferase [Pyrinomonadaceae bacterium]
MADLAALLGSPLSGDGQVVIRRISSFASAEPGSVAFVETVKALEEAQACAASCVISPDTEAARQVLPDVPAFIQSAQPKLAFAKIATFLHPPKYREPFVHSSAVIAETANIDLTVYIGPHVSIGEETRIEAGTRLESGVTIGDRVHVGNDCVLHPGVTLYDDVIIGNRVVLHAGVCIGADGFGYVRDADEAGAYYKFPQSGTVLIEDNVELGAHTCVDRAALGQTRIGRGTKIDNLVHVGHNCDIGERVIIAAQTGISGSVTIEDDVVIGGQVGFGDHIRVMSGAVIGSKAGVLPGKIVRPGVWWGIPIQPLDEYKRLNAHLARVPEMREEIKKLKKELQELKTSQRS